MKELPGWDRSILGLIAGVEAFFAVGILVDRYRTETQPLFEGVAAEIPADTGPLWGDLLLSTVVAACAVALVGAIYLWNTQPRRARSLALVGLAPPLLAGIVFFWFPPFWILTLASAWMLVRIALRTVTTPAVR